jgi:uncharacterized protein YhhL (DUF1145 family)
MYCFETPQLNMGACVSLCRFILTTLINFYHPQINPFDEILTKFTIYLLKTLHLLTDDRWPPSRPRKWKWRRGQLLIFGLFQHPSTCLKYMYDIWVTYLLQNCSKYWEFRNLVDVSRMRPGFVFGRSQGAQVRCRSSIWSRWKITHGLDWQGITVLQLLRWPTSE